MSSLLERLRSETHPFHEQTERLLYSNALRAGALSPDEYRHLLLTHAAYHESLEQAIDRFPDFFDGYDPGARRKTSWLQHDLNELQLTRTPSLPPAFTDWSPVELLGAAYVGEGSMLGGKTVWHYLQQSPAIQPLLHNARFYQGYGPETGIRWKDFGLFITGKAAGRADQVVEAAGRAFEAYQVLFAQTRSDVRERNPF